MQNTAVAHCQMGVGGRKGGRGECTHRRRTHSLWASPQACPRQHRGSPAHSPAYGTHTHTVHFLLAGLEAELARRMTRASFTAW